MLEISIVIDEEILKRLHLRKEKYYSFLRFYLSETAQKATIFEKIFDEYEKNKNIELKDNSKAIPIFLSWINGFIQKCNADKITKSRREFVRSVA